MSEDVPSTESAQRHVINVEHLEDAISVLKTCFFHSSDLSRLLEHNPYTQSLAPIAVFEPESIVRAKIIQQFLFERTFLKSQERQRRVAQCGILDKLRRQLRRCIARWRAQRIMFQNARKRLLQRELESRLAILEEWEKETFPVYPTYSFEMSEASMRMFIIFDFVDDVAETVLFPLARLSLLQTHCESLLQSYRLYLEFNLLAEYSDELSRYESAEAVVSCPFHESLTRSRLQESLLEELERVALRSWHVLKTAERREVEFNEYRDRFVIEEKFALLSL